MLRHRVLMILVIFTFLGPAPQADAFIFGTKCGWFGTAPVCLGKCPGGYTTLYTADDSRYLGIGDLRIKDKDFGRTCLVGKKAFCCKD